jgi:hypothetical protein
MSKKVKKSKPNVSQKPKGTKKLVIHPTVKKFLAAKPNTKTKKKDLDIEIIIKMIIDGLSYRAIAKKLHIDLHNLHNFTSSEQHSARVREALTTSADTFAEMAEDIMIKARMNQWSLVKARELAQHYRWMASKRRPKSYGDKVQTEVSGTLGLQQITGMQVK